MTDDDKLVPVEGAEAIDISKRIDENLYAVADTVVVESELASFDTDFFKQELEKDVEGLVFRPAVIGINHKSGTFDLAGVGIEDYSPKELKVQVIDHAKNRALWPLKVNPDNKLPLCSSFDAVSGSLKMPDGTPVPCAKCVFGQWWKPGELISLVKTKGEKSAPYAAYKYLNGHLSQSDSAINSVEEAYAENAEKNLPPACKEIRRLFIFAYDYAEKGVLNQALVLQVPTSSISSWDKYRQDLSLRTVTLADKRKVPMILSAVITSITLEKTPLGNKIYSKVNFSFDRIASAFMTKNCIQIRNEKAEDVMKFQMTLSDFSVAEAIDPTSLDDVEVDPKAAELGETIVIDDDDEMEFSEEDIAAG